MHGYESCNMANDLGYLLAILLLEHHIDLNPSTLIVCHFINSLLQTGEKNPSFYVQALTRDQSSPACVSPQSPATKNHCQVDDRDAVKSNLVPGITC